MKSFLLPARKSAAPVLWPEGSMVDTKVRRAAMDVVLAWQKHRWLGLSFPWTGVMLLLAAGMIFVGSKVGFMAEFAALMAVQATVVAVTEWRVRQRRYLHQVFARRALSVEAVKQALASDEDWFVQLAARGLAPQAARLSAALRLKHHFELEG